MSRLAMTIGAVVLLTASAAFAHDRDRWQEDRWASNRGGFDRHPWGQSYGRWDGTDRWNDRHDRYPQYGYDRNPYGYRGNPIAWGVESGRLTKNEVRDLEDEAAAIRRKEARYRADGWLAPWERNDIRHDWESYDRGLQHNLNDGERRW